MQQRGEHFWFLVAIHGWNISVLELYKNLVLVFSSPPVFTLSWGKIITIIYLACCQLRVFLPMESYARLSTAIIQLTDLKSEWNFHITWTTFPIWFSFLSHFYPIHDSEHYLNTRSDEIINARNFLPSHCHVCFFKKHKACVVWLMHCNEHFGQEGDKLGVSSTKSVVDILPQRTSSRENTFFVLLIDGMVFFYKKLILFSTLHE